jgi:gluconolactonase
VQGTLLASNIGFAEGPAVMPDGAVVFCDGNTGELLRWHDSGLERFAVTGGSPWGLALGSDGAVYVTQGGNVPGSGDSSAVCGIQRVDADGRVELLSSEVDGHTLAAPNDLAFGPDGRLWFADSGTEQDPRVDVPAPGRLFALDASEDGEMLAERPEVYPNGIAFDGAGRLYWTESLAHRVCRWDGGRATVFAQLSDGQRPDGMAFAEDGRLFVCTTISDGVTVLSGDGEVVDEIDLGEHATNCAFAGSTLYVTATSGPDLAADDRGGSFWGVETDAVGLRLLAGSL